MSLLLTSISLEKIPSQTVEAPLLQPSPSEQAQNGQAESGQWKGTVGGTPCYRTAPRTGCPECWGLRCLLLQSPGWAASVHRQHSGGDCSHLTMATAPQGSWEHKPGCRRGNCQPWGQSLPPPLLWTQTLHQETEGQSQHTEAFTGSRTGARPAVWSHTQPA